MRRVWRGCWLRRFWEQRNCGVELRGLNCWFVRMRGWLCCRGEIRRGPVRGCCRRGRLFRGVAGAGGVLPARHFGWHRVWRWVVSCECVRAAERGSRGVDLCRRYPWVERRRYFGGCWWDYFGGWSREADLRGGSWCHRRATSCHLVLLWRHPGTGWDQRVLRLRGHRLPGADVG